MKRLPSRLAFAALLVVCAFPLRAVFSAQDADPLLVAMQRELKRATTDLAKSSPAPYYLSYTVSDTNASVMAAIDGSMALSTTTHQREADVVMRVGAPALDNTHGQSRASGMSSGVLPLDDDPDAIARVLWLLTNQEYEKASAAFTRVKTSEAVQSEEEDKSPDFSQDPPQTHLDESHPTISLDQKAWQDRLSRISAVFKKHPGVYTSYVMLTATADRSYLATSEGAALIQPSAMSRLIMQADTRADDGMDLLRVETFEAPSADQLPSESELDAKAEKMAADLKALRAAPVADPYAGPALLSGRAAAVFFHEVLGHRLEGHRQRGENEGQTFTKKVGQQVLPSFLTVVDDPTMHELNGVPLAGSYAYDDEGMPAQRVVAVQDGILRNFLMSRMPITNFAHSNGHGRDQAGLMPTGRQGNLIVTSTNSVPDAELRKRFIDEIKKQGKPYGLYFEDIQGGFTLTERSAPQAFQVLPVMVWRVYPDGRPDELVRGVDIVGTPLSALNDILVTGDKLQVFNGVCGAESGQIPVAAAAPAMLFSEIEVQKRRKGTDRPPILPPPGFENSAPAIAARAQTTAGSNR